MEVDEEEDGEVAEGDLERNFRAALDAPLKPPAAPPRFHEAGWDAFTTGVVYARLAERLKETGKTIVPNRLHLMRTPHEIALGSHNGDEISESEFAEPLAPAPAGAAWHVRLDRVNGARAPGHDDVKQLVVAMGATSCRRASPVADDGTAWCCDVELADGATLSEVAEPRPEVAHAAAAPWSCFEEQRARLDAAAAAGKTPKAPASGKGGRGSTLTSGKTHAKAGKRLWAWLVSRVRGSAPAAPRKRATAGDADAAPKKRRAS
mmetsp:Transcript_12901/g.38696  ORF Transcript_12901/g.38696 Transcript_12901/m.38696 type:complete len:263 (-) Transcript_12901:15-803(-)